MASAGLVLVGALLVVLHRSDGGEVTVNAEQVTSLRAPVGALRGLAPHSNCLVWTTDSKFIGTLETCAEVKQRLETAR